MMRYWNSQKNKQLKQADEQSLQNYGVEESDGAQECDASKAQYFATARPTKNFFT